VFFDGELIKLKDLPKNNFNKPYVFNLTYLGKYFDHLTVSAALKYTTSYKKLLSLEDEFGGEGDFNPETGLNDEITYGSYGIVEFDDAITVDCSFSWEQKIYRDQKLIFTLEVLNILDAKNKTGEGTRAYYKGAYRYNIYQLGRQFWAGIAYEF
jgi:outer membrane receptor protein involved in Fe transport